jgi:hypothetical protein
MSPDFERLIGRAVTDKQFRDGLLADPEGTVRGTGFSLSADEMKQLKDSVEQIKADMTADEIDQSFGIGIEGIWN